MKKSNCKSSLGEILRIFLRLGLTAFGGPAAHLGLMEREAVERRGWMSRAPVPGPCRRLQPASRTRINPGGDGSRL